MITQSSVPLRVTTSLSKASSVFLPAMHAIRKILALASIALAMVFAGSSAAAVVNGLEHSSVAVHQTAHLPFSSASVADLDALHGDHGEHQRGDPATDAPHHHADAPTGYVAVAPPLASASVLLAPLRQKESASRRPSTTASGLKRPPKALAFKS